MRSIAFCGECLTAVMGMLALAPLQVFAQADAAGAEHHPTDIHAVRASGDDGPSASACMAHVIPYSEWSPESEPAWSLILDALDVGALYYYGASHSDDPSHQQFADIEEAYEAFEPTVVFYEGPARPTTPTREETIREYGESGFLRFLAERDGVAIERLEPDPGAEMQYVMESWSDAITCRCRPTRSAARSGADAS